MTGAKASSGKKFTGYLAVSILLVVFFLLSLCVGKYPITLNDIVNIFTGGPVDRMVKTVFLTLRLPRTVMVIMAGAGLSMAGSVFQTIFKNPLAAPDIIGVSSGANLGAAVAIILIGGGTVSVAISAFAGGFAVVFITLALTAVVRNEGTVNIILSGIVISSLAHAVIMALKLFSDPEKQLAALEFWAMGSFGNVTGDKLFSVLPLFLAGITGLILLRWQINLLSLSDDEGKTLGIRVRFIRYVILIFATLVVASIVCITGLITFIGLIAPHLARLMMRRNNFNSTIFSGLVGAALLLVSDCFARTLSSSEVPISILTSFIGAPFLAYFMYRGSRQWIY